MQHDGPDDLAELGESPLVAALRAPGTPAELAGQDAVLAAFRAQYADATAPADITATGAAAGGTTMRRTFGRLGVSGVAVVATLALSSGVAAAAYTRVLPEPVQGLAHHAFKGIGVPAPADSRTPATVRAAPVPDASPSSDGPSGAPTTAAPEPSGASPTDQSSPEGVIPPAAQDVTTAPSGAPTPTASAAPTSPTSPVAPTTPAVPGGTVPPETPGAVDPSAPVTDPTAPVPTVASVIASPGQRKVALGSRVAVDGTLAGVDQAPLPGQRVWLLQRTTDGRWARSGRATSGDDGRVSLTTRPLGETTLVRIATRDSATGTIIRSRPTRIGVRPALVLTTDGSQVRVDSAGARSGDAVTVHRRAGGTLERLGTVQIDGSGVATYDLSALTSPTGKVRVVVRMPRTRTHLATRAVVVVRLSDAAGAPAGTAGSSTTSGS